jgi:RNA-directed DNA polymerase
MHEREKSDPVIGARKPTNKVEARPLAAAAEPVEQRTGAKGNADEQSTHRTQGRERVSQALERVRKAARLKKDEKFTALLHHINLDLLREAFFALKRDAAPGVDGVTWRTYEADLDLNSLIWPRGSIGEHTGRYRRAERTYQRPTEDSAHLRCLPSKTK